MKISKLLLLLSLAVPLSACRSVPYTDRSQLLLTSKQEELDLGRQAWSEVKRKERETANIDYKTAVTRVGSHIAEAAKKLDYKWEFRTFESKQANAFCLPGGKIAVYTGLFQYVANDAELATVLAHEVGHALARHGGERISEGMLQQTGVEVLSASVDPGDKEVAVAIYSVATNVLAMLPYSRTHEYEADHIGIMLMAEAGYDPRYAITFWSKFAKASKSNVVMELLQTHPMSEKRILELKKLLPEALRRYHKTKFKYGMGRMMRSSKIIGK
ncbi:MAG: M48 family metallopeptidase [Victivallales bacterium]|nr:M48 family metallopeptidase [Victivallales bacterium]